MNKPKFRVWDKNEEKWIGIKHLGYYDDGELWYLQSQDENGVDCDPPYFEDDLGVSWNLMQYTGLKDNSEEPIEIWQKSIVKIVNNDGDYFFGVVEYFGDRGYPAFDIDCKYYKDWHFDSNVLSEALGNDNLKIYVIGDEYSNPELLNEVE